MNGFNHRNCHNNQEKKGPLEKVVMKSIKFLSAKSSPFKINENQIYKDLLKNNHDASDLKTGTW